MWLSAVKYYADNFLRVKEIVSRWPDSGILVEKAKEAVNQPNVAVELTTIMRCYSCLLPLLPKFESQSFSLFVTKFSR